LTRCSNIIKIQKSAMRILVSGNRLARITPIFKLLNNVPIVLLH